MNTTTLIKGSHRELSNMRIACWCDTTPTKLTRKHILEQYCERLIWVSCPCQSRLSLSIWIFYVLRRRINQEILTGLSVGKVVAHFRLNLLLLTLKEPCHGRNCLTCQDDVYTSPIHSTFLLKKTKKPIRMIWFAPKNAANPEKPHWSKQGPKSMLAREEHSWQLIKRHGWWCAFLAFYCFHSHAN